MKVTEKPKRMIYLKSLIPYESELKIKVTPSRTFFLILLTSAVICKQRLLHKNEIVQYLQNYSCFVFDQSHFKEASQSSPESMKSNFP